MENAYILFVNILVMLIYAVPGFILVKTKMLSASSIQGFNTLLLYVAQPCLVYYSFAKTSFELRILLNMLFTLLIVLGVIASAVLIFFFFNREKEKEDIALRIRNISVGFCNCTFMGLPLIEALLPEYPEAAVYSVVFFIAMCMLGWTMGCFIISRDKSYISIKKIFLNPATVSLILFLPLFIFGVSFPEPFNGAFTLMGRMSTPLCMLILGMRLATLKFKPIVTDAKKYLTVALRQLVVPMVYILVCLVLPIETNLKTTIVICGSTSVAAVVLSYSELVGEGQKYAAGVIILSNILAVFTMPVVVMILDAVIRR